MQLAEPVPSLLPFPSVATRSAAPVAAPSRPSPRRLDCADDPEEDDEELGDDDPGTAAPLGDDDSDFEDFDDEFDDDFSEEDNDPDWDHPDEVDEPPPPSKGPVKKK